MDKILTQIIAQIFPEPLPSLAELEKKYPPRALPATAMVTRIAPSPTGFIHLGSLYASLIDERLARQTNGLFILRIEDTDKKREIGGSAELFVEALTRHGLIYDEGPVETQEKGLYGPYKQSARAKIYHSYIKDLLEKGLAYPCFTSPEELEELRAHQETLGERSGYYGRFAIWREKSYEDVQAALNQGLKPVIRLKSNGNFNNKIMVRDLLIGSREMPENDQDIVIMKTDGLPTYHFAHAVDDHLMRVTHVIRGNEWFPSLPLHLQLFQILGWDAPIYSHLAPIQKLDNGNKRKLSKRKDPEANLAYYHEAGYPEEAIIEYLLNLANSNFEDWRQNNPTTNNQKFEINLKKLANSSGPLFDAVKLTDISKEIIAKLDADTIYQRTLAWATQYDPELQTLLLNNSEYTKDIFNIERTGTDQPRKDISRWSEIKNEISYFFDDRFQLSPELYQETIAELKGAEPKKLITDFLDSYKKTDTPEIWFEKLKTVAAQHGFALNAKEYKLAPEKYHGQVGAVAKLLRLLLTGRLQTPNLCLIMQVMGEERITRRLTIS